MKTMNGSRRNARRARGFSLVELMVSLTIGLIAMVFASRVFLKNEAVGQSTSTGSEAMQNGMVALFTIAGEAEQAGYALNSRYLIGCDTAFRDNGGYALTPAARGSDTIFPLSPVIIESNATGSDAITFYAGSGNGGTAQWGLHANYSDGTRIDVDSKTYSLRQEDRNVLVVAPTNGSGKCSIAQVSDLGADAAGSYITIATGANFRYNLGYLGDAAGRRSTYAGGYARVFSLGPERSLSFHRWSLNTTDARRGTTGTFLQLQATDFGGASTAQTVAGDIVSLKAQYGLRMTDGSLTWSSAMIDADGSGVVGDAGDWQAIVAVRLAVVARSKSHDTAPAGGTCAATTDDTRPKVFGTAVPAGSTPSEVTVYLPSSPSDWRCYRYRTFETVVNLRNRV